MRKRARRFISLYEAAMTEEELASSYLFWTLIGISFILGVLCGKLIFQDRKTALDDESEEKTAVAKADMILNDIDAEDSQVLLSVDEEDAVNGDDVADENKAMIGVQNL